MIKNIGKHRVRHGDVMENLDELIDGKVDIMYSDPPWGQGNLRYWQTMNKKMTGAEKKDIEYWAFIKRILEVADLYVKDDGMVFIEYGLQWTDDIIDIAKERGFHLLEVIEMVYSSENRPLNLILLSKNPDIEIKKEYIDSVYHTKGFKSLQRAITPFAQKGMTILDPCCGMGYTAQFALDNGMRFIGNELNRKRLQKTIDRLEKSL